MGWGSRIDSVYVTNNTTIAYSILLEQRVIILRGARRCLNIVIVIEIEIEKGYRPSFTSAAVGAQDVVQVRPGLLVERVLEVGTRSSSNFGCR
jgi:hypothetical protein